MRVCPICEYGGKKVIQNEYCGTKLCLFECPHCKHRYLDGLNYNQAWFDNYYLHHYTTDDEAYSNERLNDLSDFVHGLDKLYVLDIGGQDLQLQRRLIERGLKCEVVGVGEQAGKEQYGVVVLSHTLEHIYTMPAMMKRIKYSLYQGGWLVVEVPVHLVYQLADVYDYQWQHINKFRPKDLEYLFSRNGFTVEVSKRMPDYREYQVWRIAGRYE